MSAKNAPEAAGGQVKKPAAGGGGPGKPAGTRGAGKKEPGREPAAKRTKRDPSGHDPRKMLPPEKRPAPEAAGTPERRGRAAVSDGAIRCPWALLNATMTDYHDHRWGKPARDERYVFKMLNLEGMQAGLSWSVVLNKTADLERAFDDFDPVRIAAYGPAKIEALMNNPEVIRNRLKIESVVANARAYLKLVEEHGPLSDYLWSFVQDKPVVNSWEVVAEVPARTELSDKISQSLKKLGFKFVGSTIVYSLMQAIGMVNDHLKDCSFR